MRPKQFYMFRITITFNKYIWFCNKKVCTSRLIFPVSNLLKYKHTSGPYLPVFHKVKTGISRDKTRM